jgi:hypothetical protein
MRADADKYCSRGDPWSNDPRVVTLFPIAATYPPLGCRDDMASRPLLKRKKNMTTVSPDSTGEFEFSESQNQVIGSLAGKMGLVGFVMTFFGLLQMINGVTSLFLAGNPDRVIAAAEKAGVTDENLSALKETLSGGFWSSPVTISAIAFALAGLLLFLVGLWTRQAAFGFAAIVVTKGKDTSRLMDALGSLHLKYSLIYNVVLTAAIISLVSFVFSLWQYWRGV